MTYFKYDTVHGTKMATPIRVRAREENDELAWIMQALRIRRDTQSSLMMNKEDALAQYIANEIAVRDTNTDPSEIVRAIRSQLAYGEDVYAEGYRLKLTDRAAFGVEIEVPEEALAWQLVPCGYVGTLQHFCIEYITGA